MSFIDDRIRRNQEARYGVAIIGWQKHWPPMMRRIRPGGLKTIDGIYGVLRSINA